MEGLIPQPFLDSLPVGSPCDRLVMCHAEQWLSTFSTEAYVQYTQSSRLKLQPVAEAVLLREIQLEYSFLGVESQLMISAKTLHCHGGGVA